ncbi:class II fructose-bisphosphate aldolase [Desulforamulus profundi]|uniref:class II fructose-bisphosphate aldolase n=1 Tax=Desulforamulus profundi TaxID=1383067 RepID=UPI000BFFDA5A|nr:class II fructose-bisphosphate aldolase [Desulforamulus profundi]
MGLVKTTEILREASDRGYAVGAFDVVNLEFLEGVLAGAESRRAPVILSLAQNHLDYVDMETFAGTLLRAADRASVPVSVHLDHGKDLDTVVRAIRYGFTSIMIDGSTFLRGERLPDPSSGTDCPRRRGFGRGGTGFCCWARVL